MNKIEPVKVINMKPAFNQSVESYHEGYVVGWNAGWNAAVEKYRK